MIKLYNLHRAITILSDDSNSPPTLPLPILFTLFSNFTTFTPLPKDASHGDPHADIIKAEIERRIQSKDWQESALKNNIFRDCAEPSSSSAETRNVPVEPPIRKFTTLNLNKRQRNS